MAHKRIAISIDSNLITAGDILHGTLSLISISPATVDEITIQIRGRNILVDCVTLESKGEIEIPFSVPVPTDILHAGVQCRLGSDVFQLYASVRLHGRFRSLIHTIRFITVKSPGSITEYSEDGNKHPNNKEISIRSYAFTTVSPSVGGPEVRNKLSLLQNLRSLFCCSTAEKFVTNLPEPEKPRVLPKLGARMGYQTAYNVFVFPEFCKFDNDEVALSDRNHLWEI